MIDRILQIIKERNLTAKQFALILDIPPAIITHISNRRNNPSLDLIIKIKSKIPEINLNWLLLGEGSMYDKEIRVNNEIPYPNQIDDIPETTAYNSILEDKIVESKIDSLTIEKIIILYTNGLFKEYKSI